MVCLYSVYLSLIFIMLVGELTIIFTGLWRENELFTIVLVYAVVMFFFILLFPVILSLFTNLAC
jgi:hypothetical protein